MRFRSSDIMLYFAWLMILGSSCISSAIFDRIPGPFLRLIFYDPICYDEVFTETI